MKCEFTTAGDPVTLTDLGQKTLTERFDSLVTFADLDRRHFATQQDLHERLEELWKPYGPCYSRYADLARLPNTLLFGSDIVGPDLGAAFSALIEDPEAAQRFLQLAQVSAETFRIRGRGLHLYDEEAIQAANLSPEQVINASPPSHIPFNYCGGNGIQFMLFKPELMGKMVIPYLYKTPPASAIEKIVVAWDKPFKLKTRWQ